MAGLFGKRTRRRSVAAVALLVVCAASPGAASAAPAPASTAIVYADPNGSGTACTKARPCPSQTAADLADSRLATATTAIVRLAPGDYDDPHGGEGETVNYFPSETVPPGHTLIYQGTGAGPVEITFYLGGYENDSPTGTVVFDSVEFPYAAGSAVTNAGAGTLVVRNSAILGTGAVAPQAAVEDEGSGRVEVVDTTVTDGNGPLIWVGGSGTVDVRFGTLAGGNDGAAADVVHQGSGRVTLLGSILSGISCDHGVYSGGFNLESDRTCITPGGYSRVGVRTIGLGGATGSPAVRPIPAGSPAVGFVPGYACPPRDERGLSRPGIPNATSCDAGAFEYRPTS